MIVILHIKALDNSHNSILLDKSSNYETFSCFATKNLKPK